MREHKMNFDDYQRDAARTSDPSQPTIDRLTNGALGLGGEAGEVIELVKKHRYHGDELGIDPLCKELGDLLWYVAEMASAVGVSLGAIARTNIKKLRARYPDGFEEGGGIRDDDLQWYRPNMDTRETFDVWPHPCSHVIVGDPDTYPNQRDCDRCGHPNDEHACPDTYEPPKLHRAIAVRGGSLSLAIAELVDAFSHYESADLGTTEEEDALGDVLEAAGRIYQEWDGEL